MSNFRLRNLKFQSPKTYPSHSIPPLDSLLFSPLPTKKVTMLSGRSCSQIFSVCGESVRDVLEQSARLLGLDPDLVVKRGKLMSGTSVINNLSKDFHMRSFPSRFLALTLVTRIAATSNRKSLATAIATQKKSLRLRKHL